MKLPSVRLRVAVLLGLLNASSAVLQVSSFSANNVARRARSLLLDAGSRQKIAQGSPSVDHSQAFVMFTTSDSFFVEEEEKNATLFTYSVSHKLSQVLDVPWTRFGVFLTVYNSTDRTVENGVANSCIPDEAGQIECKLVKHAVNESGVLLHSLLQTSMSKKLNDGLVHRSVWRPSQLTYEVVIEPATYKNGDNMTAEDVAHKLVIAAQEADETLASRFHMLFPSTEATLGATAFSAGLLGGAAQNSMSIGFNPSGHKYGPLSESPKIETALDIGEEAEKINADTNKRLKELDSSLKRSAIAHYDALRFTPYTPPTVAPSGALMLHDPDYPPGPD